MTLTVNPQQFSFVFFDAAALADAATAVIERLGMADHTIEVHVDETTPLAKITTELGPPIVIRADSGAFEDVRRPRHLSERAVMLSLGRALIRARDRLDGTFGEAPADADLTLAQNAAWEVYAVGRLERLGQQVNQQRFRYNFRNRHGFTDTGDSTFEQVWASERLTWNDLNAISQAAIAAKTPVA
jgi:hypothetical protein